MNYFKKIIIPSPTNFDKTSEVLIFFLVFISTLVLLGWLDYHLLLKVIGDKDIPMAPLASILFVFFGIYMVIPKYIHKIDTQKKIQKLILYAIISISFFIAFSRILNVNFILEELFFGETVFKNGARIGRVSLVVASQFIVFSLVLGLSKCKNRIPKNVGLVILIIAFLFNFILLEAYIFHAPFFYTIGFIPPASVALFCFILLSSIILINYDRETFLLKIVFEESTKAKLLRLFIPFTLFITFIESIAIVRILPLINVHPALTASLLVVLIFIGVIISIPRIANSFSNSLDKAIEDLQKSEEDFKSIFELNSSAIVIVNELNKVIRVNSAFCKISGFDENEMLGQYFNPQVAYIGKDLTESEIPLSQNTLTNYQFQLVGKYQNKMDCLLSKNWNQNNNCGIYTFIDITEKKLAENKLIESEQKLKETLLTKDKIISIIGHDLRNPINNILALSEILVEAHNASKLELASNCASNIQSSASHTLKLLNNLIDWAILKTGQIIFDPQYHSLNSIITDVVEQITLQANFKGVKILFSLKTDMNVLVDKKMIETIIRNLVSNSIKYTLKGGWVEISALQNQDEILFVIQDNGIGMDESQLSKLFNQDKLHSTMGTNNEKGTGLGLLLCKEFVEKHQGKIWVESTLGIGSKFSFTVPLSG